MIVYKNTKKEFLDLLLDKNIDDVIEDSVKETLGRSVSASEKQSWSNSIPQVAQLLQDSRIPDGATVAIEYQIPRSMNRIDFIVAGTNAQGENCIVIIELKQWSKASKTEQDGIVKTHFAHGEKSTLHPSYQAWSYSQLLKSYNVAVYEGQMRLYPCAFLHNYKADGILNDDFYGRYTELSPIFFKDDKKSLRQYIADHICHDDTNDCLSIIENSKIRPSKVLADQLASMLKGNDEFTLIDSQKKIFEQAKSLETQGRTGEKHVLIVHGGPGTGKSVVAINLLAAFTKKGSVAQYVTRNSAPRLVYEAKLTGTLKKSEISAMFSGSGSYHSVSENTFDALIVDEAHRLNAKSGMFYHLGENQVKEIIRAANLSIFFLDEDQRVTLKDIGSADEITRWANELDATVHTSELTSQFRCSGSDGYLAWLDNTLGIRPTANVKLNTKEYDFRVFDDPNALHDTVKAFDNQGQTSRVIAGYCWPWNTKSSKKAWKSMTQAQRDCTYDITFPHFDYAARWNLDERGQSWIIHQEAVDEVGCIHTSQGLEVDYIGVFIGADFVIRNGQIEIIPEAHPGTDKALQGWKALVKSDPEAGRMIVEEVIKNTYRTLLTRGAKGCFIFSEDKETRDHFHRSLL